MINNLEKELLTDVDRKQESYSRIHSFTDEDALQLLNAVGLHFMPQYYESPMDQLAEFNKNFRGVPLTRSQLQCFSS